MFDRILSRAKNAEFEDDSRYKVLAIIVDKKGNVISQGINSFKKTHPVQAHYCQRCNKEHNIFLHAEIAALVKCRKDPYAIYVMRFLKDGKLALAKPCEICYTAIRESGIEKCFYTDSKGRFKELKV